MAERLIASLKRKGSEAHDHPQEYTAHPVALWRIHNYSVWSLLGVWPVKLINTWTAEEVVVRVLDQMDVGGQIQYAVEEV